MCKIRSKHKKTKQCINSVCDSYYVRCTVYIRFTPSNKGDNNLKQMATYGCKIRQPQGSRLTGCDGSHHFMELMAIHRILAIVPKYNKRQQYIKSVHDSEDALHIHIHIHISGISSAMGSGNNLKLMGHIWLQDQTASGLKANWVWWKSPRDVFHHFVENGCTQDNGKFWMICAEGLTINWEFCF